MKKLFSIILITILIFSLSPTVYAADAIAQVEAFDGDTANINKSDNYYLDVVSLGLFDTDIKMINAISNMIFGLEKWIVRLTCVGFYHATNVNIADAILEHTGGVQKSLKETVFDILTPLAFSFVGLYIAWLLLKRNMQEIFTQLLKFVLIIVSASLLVSNSPGIISGVDTITRTVSSAVMSAMTGQEDTGNYGLTTAEALWKTLIHEPWLTLEFGDKNNYEPDENVVKKLLSDGYAPNIDDERQDLIDKENEGNKKAFSKYMPMLRVPLIFLYLIPLLIKCFVYLSIAILQLAFWVMTILMFYVGIIVLLLSQVPQLGGTQLIVKWLRKIAEMQIMIVLLSFTLGFILMIDSILYKYVSSWGWLVVMIIQTALSVIIFVYRDKVLSFFQMAQGVVKNSRAGFVATTVLAARAYRNLNRQVSDVNKNFTGTGSDRNTTRPDTGGDKDRSGEKAKVQGTPNPTTTAPAYKETSKVQRPSISNTPTGVQGHTSPVVSTASVAANEAPPKDEKRQRPRLEDNPDAASYDAVKIPPQEGRHIEPQEPENSNIVVGENVATGKSATPRPRIEPEGSAASSQTSQQSGKTLEYTKITAAENPAMAGVAAHHSGNAPKTGQAAPARPTTADASGYTKLENVKAGVAASAPPLVTTSTSSPPPMAATTTARPTTTDSTPNSIPNETKPKASTSPEKPPKTQAKSDKATNMENQNKTQREAASSSVTSNLNLGNSKPRTAARRPAKEVKRPVAGDKPKVNIDIEKVG